MENCLEISGRFLTKRYPFVILYLTVPVLDAKRMTFTVKCHPFCIQTRVSRETSWIGGCLRSLSMLDSGVRVFCWILLLTAGLMAQPIGRKLPEFDFKTLDGQPVTLKADRPTMLLFWCTNCASCRRVELDFDRLVRKYKGKVQMVALSSHQADDPEKVRAFLKARKVTFPVWMDTDSEAARYLGVDWTTTSTILDSNGRIVYWGSFRQGREAIKAVVAGRGIMQPVDEPGG